MAVSMTKNRASIVIDKLIRLARGDLDLVQKAIHVSATGKDKAPLEDVVKYIVANRPKPACP
jgi:hypothetical protein